MYSVIPKVLVVCCYFTFVLLLLMVGCRGRGDLDTLALEGHIPSQQH